MYVYVLPFHFIQGKIKYLNGYLQVSDNNKITQNRKLKSTSFQIPRSEHNYHASFHVNLKWFG